jgi:hypothetical protein
MAGEATKVFRDTNGDRLVIAAGGELYRNTQSRQTKSANFTAAEGDVGMVNDIDTDGVVVTLPATVAGMTFRFRNAGADAAVGISLSPNAVDKIMGVGLTSADNKDLINTKATAKKGDFVTLVGDGVNGWYVQELVGTWAREA